MGVPSAILNDRLPLAGLPSCGLRPHLGIPARGEWSLSIASGTPLPCGSIIKSTHYHPRTVPLPASSESIFKKGEPYERLGFYQTFNKCSYFLHRRHL